MIDCQLPYMRHMHATVENKSEEKKYQRKMKNTNAASLRPQVTTKNEKKKNPFVRHGSSGPLENKKKSEEEE